MSGWQMVAVILGIIFSISAVLKQILPTRKMRPDCEQRFKEMDSKIKKLDSRTDEIEKVLEVIKSTLVDIRLSLETLNKNMWNLVSGNKNH